MKSHEDYRPMIVQGGSSFWSNEQVGVAGFPSGFSSDGKSEDSQPMNISQAASAELFELNKNLNEPWRSTRGLPLVDPLFTAPLLTIAALHAFGYLSEGSSTNNWLLAPLTPPCNIDSGEHELFRNFSPPACLKFFPSRAAGLDFFFSRLDNIGLLNHLQKEVLAFNESDGAVSPDLALLAAMIYPLPEISLQDPNEPLSQKGFIEFLDNLWVVYNAVMQGIAPDSPRRWQKTSYVPPFGSENTLENLKQLPADQKNRIFTAAAMIAAAWPIDAFPLKTVEEGQTAIQAALAISSNFGDFGKVGNQETNNWIMSGDASSTPNSCTVGVFNPIWSRCVVTQKTPFDGARSLVMTLAASPKTREALLTGDLGKLAFGLLQDGYFNPLPATKDMWTSSVKKMGESLNAILALSGDTPRWKITDYVPQEFANLTPPPNPCKPGEDYVNGACVQKDKPSGIDTDNMAEGGKKKGSMWWWLAGGVAVAAGAAWWMKSEQDKKSSGPSFLPRIGKPRRLRRAWNIRQIWGGWRSVWCQRPRWWR